MMQGVLVNTLATLGYILTLLLPHTFPYSPNLPVKQYIREYVYVVRESDTLMAIAEKHYGSKDYWSVIWNDNPDINDPNFVSIGMRLKLRIDPPLLVEKVKKERIDKLIAFYKKTNFRFTASLYKTGNKQYKYKKTDNSLSHNGSSLLSLKTNYEEIYKKAGEKYGVPWQILYGLHLTETGLGNGEIYNSAGSGAQGPLQFMPGTWRAYGVDGNGDGVANINEAVDAIHTAANFLAKHGDLSSGLRDYGGNTHGTLTAACEKGYCL